jgi:hypothetical protein
MDPLILAAGTALVTAMATDGWKKARSSAVALWRRVHPDRVPAIEAELEEVRGEVLAARADGDPDTEKALAADWQRRLKRLLADEPGLAAELRRVLDEEWTPLLEPAERTQIHSVVQHANATGRSTITQAGRDINTR